MTGGKDLRLELVITADGRVAAKQLGKLTRAVEDAGKSARKSSADQQRLAKGVDRASDEAAQGAKDQKALARSTGRAGDRATASARQHDRLSRSLQRAGDRAGLASRSFRLLGAAAASIGLAGLGRSIVGVGMSFEQLRLRMEVFSASAEEGAARFADLQRYAARTPFALQGVVDAFLRLESNNFGPVLSDMEALGDIAAANGRTLLELADAVAGVGRGEYDPS